MISDKRKLPILIPNHLQNKIATHSNLKYRAIGLLMLDASCRPLEAVRIQAKHLDFETMKVTIQCAKKKPGKLVYREVKMTKRLMHALAEHWKSIKELKPDTYLFPSRNKAVTNTPHLQAKQVHRWFKRNIGVMPKQCRHTFASKIVNETKDIRMAQKLLGHENQSTTEVYLHIPQAELDRSIEAIEYQTKFQKIKEYLFPSKPVYVTPMDNGITKFHIGREVELRKLAELKRKKVNVVIIGEHGVGKTHLLENIPADEFTLRIDDLQATKRAIKGLIMELLSRMPEMANMLYAAQLKKAGVDLLDAKETLEAVQALREETIGKVISRDSIHNLIELAKKITEVQKWTIIIDDVTNMGRNGVIALEKLKNHFHIIMAARQVKIVYQSAVSNFQRVELKPLSRGQALDLVQKLSYKFMDRIEDYELYKSHIWEQTGGNPLYIYELADRYRKENEIDNQTIRDINHTSGLKEVNLFTLFIGLVACTTALRYIGKANGGDQGPWYLIAGIGMVFLFFGREMMRYGKRKFV